MERGPLTAIIMATMLEAKPFVLGMKLEKSEQKPFPVFKNEKVVLSISGIGKANAAMAAALCCERFKPFVIFNLGAAGATDFSHPLGEIYHIEKIVEYDRPELRSATPYVHRPRILDGFHTAVLATSDKAVIDPDERGVLSEYAGLVDMEGAPVVQACRLFQKECLVFKFVTDTPDHTNDTDIRDNIRLYRTPFYEHFYRYVLPSLFVSL